MNGEDGLPSDDAILEFIDGCEAPPTVKDVARAFKLPQELRAPLRRRLRDLVDRGAIARQGGRKLASTDQLPEVTVMICLLYTSPSPRDRTRSRMPSSA